MFLRQVPATRPHEKRGCFLVEPILLAFGTGEADGATYGIAQVHLAIDQVAPGGRGPILKISHENIRAGIEGVDDHLAIDWTSDFGSAVLQVGGDGGYAPLTLANG